MPAQDKLDQIFCQTMPDGEEEIVPDLAGFQVTKAELFSHTREPALTIWPARIRFNMSQAVSGGNAHTAADTSGAKAADHPALSARNAGRPALGERRRG